MSAVRNIVHRAAVTCHPNASLSDVAREMKENNVGCVVVVDEAGHIAGIVTDRDIVVRAVARDASMATPVRKMMTRDVVTVPLDADATSLITQISTWGCRRVPVVNDDGAVAGVISVDDVAIALEEAAFKVTRPDQIAQRH
jgi:CBS domain-containing protein